MSAITLNGTAYEADLTDLAVLRDLLGAYHAANELNASTDDIARLEHAVAYAERAKSAIGRAIGADAVDALWGDRLPLAEMMDALAQLAALAGPTFDEHIRAL